MTQTSSASPARGQHRAVALLRLRPMRVVKVLATTTAALVALNIAVHLFTHLTGHDHVRGLVPLFDLDQELNLPAFFGALLLLGAAALLALQAVIGRAQGAADSLHWTLLALLMLLMTFDEVAGVHELLTEPIRELLGAGRPGFLHFAWVLSGAVLVAAVALAFRPFFARLPAAVRPRILLAGTLYLGGALGVEMISGHYASLHSTTTLFYRAVLVSIEEGLEMAGLIVLIHALLLQTACTTSAVQLDCSGVARPASEPAQAAMATTRYGRQGQISDGADAGLNARG
jgi:hypothetical protein